MQSKDWCFTLNNYDESDVDRINGLNGCDELCYLVCGREIGESGTRHLQGFLQTRRKKTMAGIKDLLGSNSIHLEARRGTPTEASEYCKKENNWFEFGQMDERRGRGFRSDLVAIQEKLHNRTPISNIAREHFSDYIRYHRGIMAYQSLLSTPRDFRTQVVWFHGPTGTGKSKRAFSEAHNLSGGSVCYVADISLKWFDPYSSEKAVILDDFDGSAPIALLLRLFDRYPMRVPIKGGFVEWCPRIVWITSNRSPEELYGSQFQYDALLRRIDEITLIN